MAVGMKMLADGEGDGFRFSWLNRRTCSWSNVYRKENKGNQKNQLLSTILPTATTPTMLLDSGANADCRPEMLTQFGIMGSAI